MSATQVIVLAENQTPGPSLVAEHGLSMLVLAHGRRVLFDTGLSGALVENAQAMGVADELARIDAIVISHGHYDHAGGLAAVLEHVRKPVAVHVRPGFFAPRLSLRGDIPRAIGVPFEQPFLEDLGARFMWEAQGREILPGFWLTGEIPLREEQDAGEAGLMLGASREHAVADTFADEQALAVDGERGLAVLVGCSHRGLVNSILAAKTAAHGGSVAIALGGAHLRSATPDQIDWAIQRAQRLAPDLALGHCTGAPAEARFAAAYGTRFRRLETGWRWKGAGFAWGAGQNRSEPNVERDDQAIAGCNGRSTFTVTECAKHNLAPLCGGGGGALAASGTGTPIKPDCRPVLQAQRQGCLSCGADLVYLVEAEPMICAGCGAKQPSRARCQRGHFFCDRCHAGSALDAIEQVCLSSDERDPMALALAAMRHPKVKMHGPEHHFLAPAVLLSAWCNLDGQAERKPALLAEARRRSEPVLGGFCGFQGACGAGVGAGIFVSIVGGGSPMKGRERGMSIRATSEALKVIGHTDAPRCCKRDIFLGLLSAARFARKNLGIDFPTGKIRCEFSHMNRECIGDACPFHARRA